MDYGDKSDEPLANQSCLVDLSPRIAGYFVLPSRYDVIDVARILARDPEAGPKLAENPRRQSIQSHTITGGVPDACDPLPEGTVIVSP